MADLAAYHAEADRLLAAVDEPAADEPAALASRSTLADVALASRPGPTTLRAMRALRTLRPEDLDRDDLALDVDAEWSAYFRRRGVLAVYSYLLTIMRAGM